MGIPDLCATIKQRVSVELQRAADPDDRNEILIAALYEVSRSVLPLLGTPKKSREYLDWQAAVLDLIAFIGIPLVRGQARRGVAVLSEIAEGCPDPQARKKLTVYAHELLAKSHGGPAATSAPGAKSRFSWLLLPFAAAALALYFAWPAAMPDGEPDREEFSAATAPEAGPAPSGIRHGSELAPAIGKAPGDHGSGSGRADEPVRQAERAAPEPAPIAQQGEQVTRVRIVNNQVLVPVLLKNGGEAVALELVLDTGATRTVIHDVLAGRLRIDLRLAKTALSEVADGRVIRSRIAQVDSLAVGPFVMAPAELELIAYSGAERVRDGLLGMDFLGKRRYQIDMEHGLIRWF